MYAQLLGSTVTRPRPMDILTERKDLLAAIKDELASLRFSIILVSRQETAASENLDRRNELRARLADLRYRFSEKIDDIAMKYGIQDAMDAKEDVERNVFVPRNIGAPETLREDIDPGI
ncbi:MAG: hypothetical protein WA802_14575 [Terracidiphilus sp.]|jgi:hypothetical protein